MDLISNPSPISCAWCGRMVRPGNPASPQSYGICLTCLGDQFTAPIESLDTLDDRAADLLPFGFIRINSYGCVLAYNTKESALSGLPREGVLGKNFFRTIAPCTCVDEFEGTLKKMISSWKPERTQIEFLFKFKDRATMVLLAMTTDPTHGHATLLIRKMEDVEAAS